MQEKDSIMVVRCRLKIPSFGITVRHCLASGCQTVNHRGGNFSPHFTARFYGIQTAADSYRFVSRESEETPREVIYNFINKINLVTKLSFTYTSGLPISSVT